MSKNDQVGSPRGELNKSDVRPIMRVGKSVGIGGTIAALIMLIVGWAVRTYTPESFTETIWPMAEPLLATLVTALATWIVDIARRWMSDTTQG